MQMDNFIMLIQFAIVLLTLYVGARYGSLALGAISGIGLSILIFIFGMEPGTPPTDVIFIIVAAITCASCLQASGGMNWLVQLAERLLRRHPENITVLAPLCTFFLTMLVGTGHVVYTLMPIIADIALKKGIRPERPCAVASVASQVGIVCSPISAAVVAFVTISAANGFDVSIPQVLAVSVPSCLCGVLAASLMSYRRGRDLDKDPEFQALVADPARREAVYGDTVTAFKEKITPKAKLSVYLFCMTLAAIVLLAAVGYKSVKMNLVIQILMLTVAALMILICDAKPSKAVSGSVFRNGMVAVVAIYGIAWLADTFFDFYTSRIQDALSAFVGEFPWAIALVFFAVSVLINSQGAVVVSMLPVAYSLGIPGPILLGVLPSVYGYFFIPNYPSDIATVNFDRSGTTKIGRYLLNHSFMMPGLVSVTVSTLVGLLIVNLFF